MRSANNVRMKTSIKHDPANLKTEADQPVANKPIPILNSNAELTNPTERSMQPSRDEWGPSGGDVIPSLSLLSRNTGLSGNGN